MESYGATPRTSAKHEVSGQVAPEVTTGTYKRTKNKQNIRFSALSVLKYKKYSCALPPWQTNILNYFWVHLFILVVTYQNCRRSELPLRSEVIRVPVQVGSGAWPEWERRNNGAGGCLHICKRSKAKYVSTRWPGVEPRCLISTSFCTNIIKLRKMSFWT